MIGQVTNEYSSSYITDTQGKSTLGKDDFMKLMIAQLKYQDPMNPMEGTEFSAQLAQFSSLEQLSNLNENITNSIQANYLLTQSVNNTMSATLIGKEVKLSGEEFYNDGQDSIKLGITLSGTPKTSEIKIYNEDGSLVRTIKDQTLYEGDNKLSWDFTDNDGRKLPEGKYTFNVETTSYSDDVSITATVFKYGLISGVRYGESGTSLLVDGSEYPLSEIMEIINPTEDN